MCPTQGYVISVSAAKDNQRGIIKPGLLSQVKAVQSKTKCTCKILLVTQISERVM